MTTVTLQSKPHYPILDGLRVAAALMVVIFHIFETHATSHLDQVLNHGYLAVDFFFLLSGFVIGYAYDDRWGTMTLKDFFKRRFVRLQPMVIFGMVAGASFFYFQDSVIFPGISEVPVWKMLLVMLIGCTVLPLPPSMDLRGWGEMHSLNGPAWSLFYEYIGNILYALFVKNFSTKLLSVVVFLSACFLLHMAVTGKNGDVVGGWSLTGEQMHIGFARLLFPFFGGLLLQRIVKPGNIKNAFLWSSLLVIAVLAFPRVGGSENLWANGLYDSLSIIILFPLIIYIGASGTIKGGVAQRVCKFFGDISYPIYITHYPIIYTYTAWVYQNKKTFAEAWPVAVLVFVSSVLLAYAALKLYDEPVRKWLAAKVWPKRFA